MSSAFQNRLVGTIILVALAVIFLPDILDGEKVSHKDRFLQVPDRPALRPVPASEPFAHQEVQNRVTRKVEIVEEVALDDPRQPPAQTHLSPRR